MSDLWRRTIPLTLAAFIVGWLVGTLPGWLTIVAWGLAVIAATLVVSAVIGYGYEDERRQRKTELESARRRVVEYDAAWRRWKLRADNAEKALRVQNRMVKD